MNGRAFRACISWLWPCPFSSCRPFFRHFYYASLPYISRMEHRQLLYFTVYHKTCHVPHDCLIFPSDGSSIVVLNCMFACVFSNNCLFDSSMISNFWQRLSLLIKLTELRCKNSQANLIIKNCFQLHNNQPSSVFPHLRMGGAVSGDTFWVAAIPYTFPTVTSCARASLSHSLPPLSLL